MLALLVAVAAVVAQPAGEAPDISVQVRRLVRELDAAQLDVRDRAEAALVELGIAALDHLPESSGRLSAEVKQRLNRVRAKLERERAIASSQASRVTLEADELPLSEILEEFSRQTGNKILDYRSEFGQEADDPRLKVAFQNATFWEAFDQVLDDAGLAVYPYSDNDEPAIAVVNRSASQTLRHGRANYVGAFRLEAIELSARRDLRDRANRSLHLQLEIAWEPRLAPIAIGNSMADLTVRDDAGNSLIDQGDATAAYDFEASVPRNSTSTDLELPLVPPPRSVEKIARLAGKLNVMLPGKRESFRFDNLEKSDGAEQRKAGVVVKLDRVRKNNEVWEVRTRVTFDDPGEALQSHRDWMFQNVAQLVDNARESLPNIGLETYLQTENAFGISYLFDPPDGLAGQAYVYETPTMILSVPVEYEVKDLELP
ncbi:MAG: hypothetical protein KF708_22025 [Pirellulales bacterium]|nr:hypothetical protein [Pirellulales bacterium]